MKRFAMSIVLAGLFVLTQHVSTSFAADPPMVRQSINEFVKDPAKLESFMKGVQEMRRRSGAPVNSAEYRTSWEYWANIHGYPGPKSHSGTVEDVRKRLLRAAPQDAPLYAGFFTGLKDFTAPDALAEEVWATCEHGSRASPAKHFLSWHRMYLYFFERVLREASGDPTFALPYWDYTNGKTSASGEQPWTLPSVFGQDIAPGTTLPNPLYEKRRTTGFADSIQIDINNAQTNVDGILSLGDFFAFSGTLETSTHGFIHCTVGNSCLAPYIGIVPFAANDPVFWLHHANIDRLWDCWTNIHGGAANPVSDATWMSKSYAFVDEKGDRVEMKVSELFDPKGRINYTYDNAKNCYRQEPKSPPVAVAMSIATAKGTKTTTVTKQISKSGNVAIDKLDQTVSIALPNNKSVNETLLLATRPHALQPTQVLLRLQGVQLTSDPGASVAVYLVDVRQKRRLFVGTLSFFGWFDHEHGDTQQGEGRNLTFDVTAQFQELSSSPLAGAPVQVAFVASDGLVGNRRPLNEARYKAAGLRVREVGIEAISGTMDLNLK